MEVHPALFDSHRNGMPHTIMRTTRIEHGRVVEHDIMFRDPVTGEFYQPRFKSAAEARLAKPDNLHNVMYIRVEDPE